MADRRPYGLVLPPFDASPLPPSVFGGTDRGHALAQSLDANLQRTTSAPSTVVFRPGASPSLAVLGWATPEEHNALETALDAFIGALSRLRYVDYARAEADCAVLAEHLRDRLSPELLDEAVFAGIPRGGHIVLGMLSYVLDLSPEQLSPEAHPSAPLVVVDDCFLTGFRAGRFLDDRPERPDVVLAGLYAHPALRAAIEQERPAVRACVTARDLRDHAPRVYGDDYADWKARCADRLGGPRYWIGLPDHLCFAWNEPDVGVWDASADRMTTGWTVVPPDRCLERRHAPSRSAGDAVSVSTQPAFDDQPLAPGPDVFYATVADRTIIADGSGNDCLVLDGPAADFWHALLEHGTVDAARRALLARYDVAADTLEADLRDFVETAVGRDLLRGEGSSAGAS